MKINNNIQHSEMQLYFMTLEKAPDAVFWLDINANIYRVNEAACRMLGYSKDQFGELTVYDIDPNYTPENWQEIVEKVKQEAVLVFETQHRTKKGKILPVEVTSNYFEFNGAEHFIAFVRDITHRKLVEKILAEKTEHQLELFFSQSLDGFFFMMLDEPVRWDDSVDKKKVLDYVFDHQRITKVNDAMLAQYGATRDAFLGLTPRDLYQHDLEYGREVWHKFFDAGRLHIETDERRLDGTPIWIEGDYICFYDEQGRITGHFGIQRDITERQNAVIKEALLRAQIERNNAELEQRVAERTARLAESEARLRAIAHALPDLVFVIDETGRHLEVMTSQEGLLYRSANEIKNRLLHDLFAPEMADRFLATIRQTLKTGKTGVEEYELPIDGATRCFEARIAQLDMENEGKKCVVWLARDITERKAAQKALSDSEARYRFLYNNTPVMMKAVDVNSHIVTANDYYLKTLGYTHEEIIGRKSTDFLTAESQQRIAEDLNPSKLAPGKLLSTDCQMITKSGKLLDAEVFAAAEFDQNGGIKQILSFFVDRSDRKRAEALQYEKLYLQQELQSELNFGEIVGASPAIKSVFTSIEMVAGTDSTVILLGETGTGKELIARAIHNHSHRKDHVLIKVNCAALPAGLVESELFGHEKGAFTGATMQKKGRFELANKGTLFLDEVGELPLETQTKLLRVLQEQEFERVGGAQTLKVNVRVIAATNRDLEAEVRNGKFRADLYYRLNIFPIRMPPLRERREDIPLLAHHFVRSFGERMGKQIEKIGSDALQKLQQFDWPGNVRELANILERAVIVCQGKVLQKQHLSGLDSPMLLDDDFPTLEEMERRHIMAALEKTGGIVAGPKGAAKLLNMHRSTLWARMQKLGIPSDAKD